MLSARVFLPLVLAVAAPGLLAGCGGGVLPVAEDLQAAETFRWNLQPISFRPPPAGWRREGENGSGRLGIMFIKTGSVGEAISIGEYYPIGERDRREELHQLAERVPALDEYALRRSLSLARWRTQDPFTANEAATAAAVNERIDRAMDAMLRGDRDAVRWEIQGAETAARGLQFTLDDVIAGVEFRPERRNQPARYTVTGRSRITLAGRPAIRIDFDLRADEGLRRCSEVYFMQGNHLFIASYIGLAKNLPLYDRVIGSIGFPPDAGVRS
jgi:hypothetical protein